MAKKIAELEEFSVELGTINWESFNDGFPDLFINDAYDIRDRHVAFLASFHNPEVIFEQLSIIYSLPKMFVASFTLVLPFFPTGTAERVAVEGEVATAVTLARMLSSRHPVAADRPARLSLTFTRCKNASISEMPSCRVLKAAFRCS